jgi:hypothetical protein
MVGADDTHLDFGPQAIGRLFTGNYGALAIDEQAHTGILGSGEGIKHFGGFWDMNAGHDQEACGTVAIVGMPDGVKRRPM